MTTPPKILVVNDSPLMGRFVRSILLQQHPHAVVLTARRGREGQHTAKLELPELVLLDHDLPDTRPEKVAAALLEDPATSGIPIILTHRGSVDVNLSSDQLVNIIQLLPRPFTPEDLMEAVQPVLDKLHEMRRPLQKAKARARIAPPRNYRNGASPSVLFRGRTDTFPLVAALSAVEEDKLSGVLRLFLGSEPVEVYVESGHLILSTTRDVAEYIEEGLETVSGVFPAKVVSQASQLQQETACPFYLTLAVHKLIPWLQAVRETQQRGVKLFSRVWTMERAAFEFEMLQRLPDFVRKLPAYSESACQWALHTMRCLDDGNIRFPQRMDSDGVPAYTPDGYELIRDLKLTESEAAFASAVDNTRTIAQAANESGLALRQAQRDFQKFLHLQVMDYWPPAVIAAGG